MKAAFLLITLSFALSQGERIYRPPVINPPRGSSSGGQSTSNQGAAVRPAALPGRQGTGEFLPQNLTFVVSARNLKSNSVDPIVKVSNSSKNGPYEVLGRTEELSNTKDPNFLKVFWIIWRKGTQQKLKFEVRDVDNLRRDDKLGEVVVDLDDYVSKGEKVNVTLMHGAGKLAVTKTTPVKFRLYARALPNADLTGKSDPFVECYWSFGSQGKKVKFGKTAVIDNNENPDWNDTLEFANYVRGTDQWWTFKVLDSDPTGSDDLGEAIVEVDSFISRRQTKILRLGKKGSATLGVTPF